MIKIGLEEAFGISSDFVDTQHQNIIAILNKHRVMEIGLLN